MKLYAKSANVKINKRSLMSQKGKVTIQAR